jgi:hypothetical protein
LASGANASASNKQLDQLAKIIGVINGVKQRRRDRDSIPLDKFLIAASPHQRPKNRR